MLGECRSGEDKNNNGAIDANETDPNSIDTDGDGISDFNEVYGSNPTNPLNPDTDGDGLCDGSNIVGGICETGEDTNNNGKRDDGETDPNKADTDEGGVNDGDEVSRGTDPLLACDDTDSCEDAPSDGDGDGDGDSDDTPNGQKAYAEEACACDSVKHTSSGHFPALASIFALLGGALLSLRRRRDGVQR